MLKKLQSPWISIKDVHLKIGASAEETKAGRAEFDAAGLKVTSGGKCRYDQGHHGGKPSAAVRIRENARLPMMVCAPTKENIKAVEAGEGI
jgi:hypothetical protein